MSDADFMAAVLSDGQWHSRDEIVNRSFAERGCGLTPHSRAPELRARGLNVECDTSRRVNGRVVSFYRMTATPDALDEAAVGAARQDRSDDALSLPSSVPAASSSAPEPLGTGFLQSPVAEPESGMASASGALQLFACETDESAGLRPGAYTKEAA